MSKSETFAVVFLSLSACGGLVAQTVRSNEFCSFVVDGSQATSGKLATVNLTPSEPHRVSCEAPGYKTKFMDVSPPYGEGDLAFLFMVEDRVDAAASWEQVHRDEDEQRSLSIRRAREQFNLQISKLEFDPRKNAGQITAERATTQDRGEMQRFVEDLCSSKNRTLVVGERNRQGAGYQITTESVQGDEYTMAFECLF
jgi:hypothetical protein